MLPSLNQLDHRLFLLLNRQHHPFWDVVMAFISDKFFWIPVYAALLGFLVYLFRSRSWLLLVTIALTITSADRISSGLIKPLAARLRPCHDASLSQVIHVVEGCGGKFGFLSSHATNSFALAVFLTVVLPARYRYLKLILFIWAVLVSYSRIYLGVHFPGDILAGAALGSILGYGWARIFLMLGRKFNSIAVQA